MQGTPSDPRPTSHSARGSRSKKSVTLHDPSDEQPRSPRGRHFVLGRRELSRAQGPLRRSAVGALAFPGGPGGTTRLVGRGHSGDLGLFLLQSSFVCPFVALGEGLRKGRRVAVPGGEDPTDAIQSESKGPGVARRGGGRAWDPRGSAPGAGGRGAGSGARETQRGRRSGDSRRA